MSTTTLLLALITNGATIPVNHREYAITAGKTEHKLCYNPALCALDELTSTNPDGAHLLDLAEADYQVTLHMTDGAKIPLATSSRVLWEDRNFHSEELEEAIPEGYVTHLSVITEATELASLDLEQHELLRISYPVTQIASFSISLLY